MVFKCSECGGEIKIINNQMICTKCNRSKVINNNKTIKEVDMNDQTKDYNDVLFG